MEEVKPLSDEMLQVLPILKGTELTLQPSVCSRMSYMPS
jgi:hypothetical protein